jgi:hypothetical protein
MVNIILPNWEMSFNGNIKEKQGLQEKGSNYEKEQKTEQRYRF